MSAAEAYARARAEGRDEVDARRAAAEAARTPPVAGWRGPLAVVAGALGAGLFASGVVTFFAANWNRLGHAPRFALVQAPFVALVAYGARRLERLPGRVALTVAAVFVGAMLAVFGQVYQTGADPADLFLAWGCLALPLALAAQHEPLWLLVSIVLATSVHLARREGSADELAQSIVLVDAAVGAVFLALWEVQASRARPVLRRSWLPRVWGALVSLALSIAAVLAIVSEHGDSPGPTLLVVAAAVGAAAYLYHFRRIDLFMQTMASGLLLVTITAGGGRLLLKAQDGAAGVLVLAMLVAIQVTAVALWIRREQRRARDLGVEKAG